MVLISVFSWCDSLQELARCLCERYSYTMATSEYKRNRNLQIVKSEVPSCDFYDLPFVIPYTKHTNHVYDDFILHVHVIRAVTITCTSQVYYYDLISTSAENLC